MSDNIPTARLRCFSIILTIIAAVCAAALVFFVAQAASI